MNGEHFQTARGWRELVAAAETPGATGLVDDRVWHNIELAAEANARHDWATYRHAIAVTGADSEVLVLEFAVRTHRDALNTSVEVEHPVAWVDLTPAPTIAELDRAICGFFGQQPRRGKSMRPWTACSRTGPACSSWRDSTAGPGDGVRSVGATTKARIIEFTGSFTGTVILCGDRLDGLFAGEDPITSQLASRTIALTTDPEQPPAQGR
jgi:hypothetical protein